MNTNELPSTTDLPSLADLESELMVDEQRLIAAAGNFSPAVLEAFSTGKYNDATLEELKPKHMQIVDFLVANPTARHDEVAARFNYTPLGLYRLKATALFRAEMARRREQAFQTSTDEVSEKIATLTNVALDRLTEKALVEQDSIALTKIANLALQASGYIDKSTKGPVTNITQNNLTFSPVQRDALAAARAASSSRFLPAVIENEKTESAEGPDK